MSKSISIRWDVQDREVWQSILERIPRPNIQQSWDYGDAAEKVENAIIERGIIYSGREAIGLVQGYSKRAALIAKYVKFQRGPIFTKDMKPKELARVFRLIKDRFQERKLTLYSIMPEIEESALHAAMLVQSGHRAVLPGYQTAWLCLRKDQDTQLKSARSHWRKNVRYAEKRMITASRYFNRDIIFKHYKRQMLTMRYRGPSPKFLNHFNDDSLIMFAAHHPDVADVIALQAFLVDGNTVTYQIGWSSEVGYQTYAGFYLLQHAIDHFRDIGLSWMDMGGIDPEKMAGITQFKLATGALPVRYCPQSS